jgi:hypothetical protein
LPAEISRKGEKDPEKAKEPEKSRKNPAHFEKRGLNEVPASKIAPLFEKTCE